MFRLAKEYTAESTKVIQKIVTEQILLGIRKCTGMGEDGIIMKDRLMEFIMQSSDFLINIAWSDINETPGIMFINQQIVSMHRQLMDRKKAYTFNEFQELLLDEMVTYVKESCSSANQWRNTVSQTEKDFIKRELASFFKEVYDLPDEQEELNEAVEEAYLALSDFRYMGACEDEAYCVTFWDWDYQLFYGLGLDGVCSFMASPIGGAMGFDNKSAVNILTARPSAWNDIE